MKGQQDWRNKKRTHRAIRRLRERDVILLEDPVHHGFARDAGRARVHDRLAREVMTLGSYDGGARGLARGILRETRSPGVHEGSTRGARFDGEVSGVFIQGDVPTKRLAHHRTTPRCLLGGVLDSLVFQFQVDACRGEDGEGASNKEERRKVMSGGKQGKEAREKMCERERE